MTIILLHKHYDEAQLQAVTDQMRRLGAPQIKAIYDHSNSMWIALEGCHRLRAAHALGITPQLIDVGIYDDDGFIDREAMDGLTINSLTDNDNLQDDPESTVGDHLDYVGRAWDLAVLDFANDDDE